MRKVNNNHQSQKKPKILVQKIILSNLSIQELHQRAIKAYQQNNSGSEDRWNQMLAQSGTKKDKISAAGMLILENPQNSLKYFDLFIKWCFDKNHNFAITACEALANVFSQHLLSERSVLKDFTDSVQNFIKQNKKKAEATNADLIAFYLQSQIKQFYRQFIKAIQILLNDDLNHIKKSCVKILGNLARHRQLRRTILALIINKLGDSDMDVVNQVSKCLKDQFYQDILASQALMEETERFLFRSNLPTKAQFFVINFLNSINLKFLNEKSLNKLFEIFYHFFTKCISGQENQDQIASRLFLNSIKGLNRVFSFMKGGSKQTKRIVEERIQDVYKIVHTTPNIKAKIQLLLFLFQSHVHLKGNISSNNRFYRVLYQFIGKEQIIHSSLLEMFFDLVLVCLKEDENLSRVLAISKRMLQLCFGANSSFIVTTLLMLDKVIQSNEGLKIFLQKPENILQDDELNNEKYDDNKRDPLFSGAQKTCLWELKALSAHFHPTIRKFATSIIKGQPIQYQGNNPILQFNLTSFIEKMSLKKQRKSDAWKIKVKRNLQKIRPSKYQTLLTKQLSDFKEDEDFIKKYLQNRNQIHIHHKKKIQTNDIEEFADQVIEKQMDRLNPKEMDQQLSITPVQSGDQDVGSWDQNEDQLNEENEGQFQEDLNEQGQGQEGEGYDEDEEQMSQMDEDLGSDALDEEEFEQGIQQKQFEDVFDEINDEDSFDKKGAKGKNKRFGNKTKNIVKQKQKPLKKGFKNKKFNGSNKKNKLRRK